MSTEQVREEFEAWQCREYGYDSGYLDRYRGKGDYAGHAPMRELWKAWQASRASLVVDLEHVGYIQVEEGNFYLNESDVNEVIRAAGITVEG